MNPHNDRTYVAETTTALTNAPGEPPTPTTTAPRTRTWAKAIALLSLVGLLALPIRAATANEPNGATKAFQTIKQVFDLIQQAYVDDVPLEHLVDGAIQGMTYYLDPYSEYFTPADLDEFTQGIENNYTGIGVEVTATDNGIRVNRVMPHTPAEAAGLEAGDILIEADGQSFDGLSLDEAASFIRGPVGTDVKLIIRRGDDQLTFTINRAAIHQPTTETEMVTADIGLIRLSTFALASTAEVANALTDLKAQGAKAIVLDLRGNPGGYLDAALQISELFLPEGKDIVHLNYSDGTRETFTSEGPGQNLPIAILVNGGTASAAEILTGALQDHDLAFVVGEPTYGKGRVQSLYNLENGAFLKMTNALYTTPRGRALDKIGLIPDFPELPGMRRNGSPVSTDRTLSLGSRGDDIVRLQERLTELGYDPGAADGIFGQRTATAVQAFQADHDLPPTGTVDADTLTALNADTEFRDRQLAKALDLLQLGMHLTPQAQTAP